MTSQREEDYLDTHCFHRLSLQLAEETLRLLTGQEVLGGGAKVSVSFLQQLQPVVHGHLRTEEQREERVGRRMAGVSTTAAVRSDRHNNHRRRELKTS